jgi:hypothetical protein
MIYKTRKNVIVWIFQSWSINTSSKMELGLTNQVHVIFLWMKMK